MEIIKFKKYLNNSKQYFVVGMCVLALTISSRAFATGEGEEDDTGGHFYSKFLPEVVENKVEMPFADPLAPLYLIGDDNDIRINGVRQANQDEWLTFFNFQVGAEPLKHLLYSMPNLELQDLINDIVLNQPSNKLSRLGSFIKAGLQQYIATQTPAQPNKPALSPDDRKALVATALGFLRFAKNVEPYALENVREDDGFFQKQPTGENVAVNDLLTQAAQLITDAKGNAFLEPRIRLQTIRLYYYQQRFAEAIQYYNDNISEFGSLHKNPDPNVVPNSVKFRFISYAAGAYYRSAQVLFKKKAALPAGQQLSPQEKTNMTQLFAKANYLNSLIFDQYPPLKISSYLAFHPMEQSDWTATLKLAAPNPDQPATPVQKNEVAVLWQLLGIYGKSNNGLDAIKAIRKIDPASPLLPLLLVREVGKAEWAVYEATDSDFNDGAAPPDDLKPVVGLDRLATIKAITDDTVNKPFKPYLWQLATGHLDALAGILDESHNYLKLAKRNKPAVDKRLWAENKHIVLEVQFQMSNVFQGVSSLKTNNGPVSDELAVDYAGLFGYQVAKSHYRARNLYKWAKKELAANYKAQGDTLRQLMLEDQPNNAFYKDNNNINKMLDLINNPVSAFDIYLSKSAKYSEGQLNELKAINDMYADKMATANASFANVGDQIHDYLLRADPFTDDIQDNYGYASGEDAVGTFTQVSVAKQISDLEKQANGQDIEAATANIQLGDAFYNMSYYGNSRDLYESQYHNNKGFITPDDLASAQNPDHPETVDLSGELTLRQDNAQKYYQKALAIAKALPQSKDVREFEARATWLLAKVERNTYTNKHGGLHFDRTSITDFVTNSAQYKALKAFSDTDYYKKIIGTDAIPECGWFSAFDKGQ